ncbi:hypothetical protein [Streptomyces sp. NBC_00503]|uniref:hypothetical protein n=1 Tax=Streptomyces sp. NBC_00503 TaxID=2903659 RepID=UPI002E7FEA4B|nr:hypothetical protein [Streptomyces sp. NBC_00503]WUD82977.1 hypothetical protein OG490_21855 [Streptomyces sp. NBC_00503]
MIRRRTATGLAVVVATAALLLTGCGTDGAAAPDRAGQTAQTGGGDDAQAQEMKEKLDKADQDAAQADADATQNN